MSGFAEAQLHASEHTGQDAVVLIGDGDFRAESAACIIYRRRNHGDCAVEDFIAVGVESDYGRHSVAYFGEFAF